MAKQFKNLKEVVNYIKKAQRTVSKDMGEELENIMKETTQDNLYNSYSPKEYKRTYDMLNMIRMTDNDENSVTVTITDTGRHESWVDDSSVYVAPILEDGGHTWHRGGTRKPPTRIIEDSIEKAKETLPDAYISSMRKKGIRVVKKQ